MADAQAPEFGEPHALAVGRLAASVWHRTAGRGGFWKRLGFGIGDSRNLPTHHGFKLKFRVFFLSPMSMKEVAPGFTFKKNITTGIWN